MEGRLVRITDEEEIKAIEEALAKTEPLKPVKTHLNCALELLSNRTNPNYRNSIKESISGVESISKMILKVKKGNLSDALSALEKALGDPLPPSLKLAFDKLYAYASAEDGIRHALMDEPKLDFEEAKFMLVACSAFVSYLIVKADKAGIKLSQ